MAGLSPGWDVMEKAMAKEKVKDKIKRALATSNVKVEADWFGGELIPVSAHSGMLDLITDEIYQGLVEEGVIEE